MIEVVDTASDPFIAREKIKKYNPDVLTLDLEMPRMNGLECLDRLMRLRPMPVVMISSLTQSGSEASLAALDAGAVDVVAKPQGAYGEGIEALSIEIIAKVKAASQARIRPTKSPQAPVEAPVKLRQATKDRVIVIGASTGGVPVIGEILAALPNNAPPILIAQHMPEGFTARFAARLDANLGLRVVEAAHGMKVEAGHVYIAPGAHQTELIRQGSQRLLKVSQMGRVNGFSPSVDVLMHSVAQCEGDKAIGVILTGMGSDGAEGMLALRQTGALTLGQNESSALVYGMPKVAFERGAVMHQLSPLDIAQALIRAFTQTKSEGRAA